MTTPNTGHGSAPHRISQLESDGQACGTAHATIDFTLHLMRVGRRVERPGEIRFSLGPVSFGRVW
jgi:hypothetical protein